MGGKISLYRSFGMSGVDIAKREVFPSQQSIVIQIIDLDGRHMSSSMSTLTHIDTCVCQSFLKQVTEVLGLMLSRRKDKVLNGVKILLINYQRAMLSSIELTMMRRRVRKGVDQSFNDNPIKIHNGNCITCLYQIWLYQLNEGEYVCVTKPSPCTYQEQTRKLRYK